MSILQKLNAKANLRKTSSADLPLQPQFPVIARYEADSTASQIIINMSFAVDQANKESFQLFIDGKLLREGALNDFTFTSIQTDNTSSQITLSTAIPAGLNIIAIKLGLKQDSSLYLSQSAGSGQINFITNGSAESETTGWGTYVDAAASSPVDGIGGTANITFTRSTSSPLIGSASFLLTKDAVNRQGQGVSYDFTIDSAYKAKVLQISFNYLVNSGTFTAGSSSTNSDVTVWIYDVTNAVLIQPSSFKLLSNNSSISDTFNATFQTASNSTSYRLIFHVGSTSASAYSLKIDGITVSPSTYVYGTPVIDFVDKGTITIGSTGTAPTKGSTIVTDKILMRRIGDSAELLYQYNQSTSGTAGSGSYLFSLPSGMSFDTSKITTSGGAASDANVSSATVIGTGSVGTSAFGRQANCVLVAYDSTRFYAFITSSQDTSGAGEASVDELLPGSTYSLSESAYGFKFRVSAPIQGWSSSVQTSDQTDTRVVSFYSRTSQAFTPSGTPTLMINSVKDIDTHSAYSTSTGLFTAPVAGDYEFKGGFLLSTGASTPELRFYKNGVQQGNQIGGSSASNYGGASGTMIIRLVSGDTVGCYVVNSSGALSAIQTPFSYFGGSRISGPSAIAASETISASYYASSTVAASSATPINFSTKLFDSHNAVTTGAAWKFTAPISGVYLISGTVVQDTAGTSSNTYMYIDGSIYMGLWVTTGNNYNVNAPFAVHVKLNAGQYIDLRNNAGITVGGTLTSAGISKINIVKVGN
jgi:hypothetical protein